MLFQIATTEQSKASSFYCEPCGKKISSEAAYENHLASSKHKSRVARVDEQESSTTTSTEQNATKPDKQPSVVSGKEKVPKSSAAMDTGMLIIQRACHILTNLASTFLLQRLFMITQLID